LTDGVNIVVGPNGSGKTNLLESLYVNCLGRSFRVQDEDLLQYNKEWMRVDAVLNDEVTRELILRKTSPTRIKKELKVNDARKRFTAATRYPVVLFEPRDMQLLTGPPEHRRAFLDDILVYLDASYERILTQYRRALGQRNRLLKDMRISKVPLDHLFVWNVRLSELGAQIMSSRIRLVETLNSLSDVLYSELSNHSSRVRIIYESRMPLDTVTLASSFLHQLEASIEKDRDRGFTSTGPHRDDISIQLNDSPAQLSASRGETRTLVVMLKIMESQLLFKHLQQYPLLLLDDIFGELDIERRQMLAQYLRENQTIITATDADTIDTSSLQYAVIPLTTKR
jgi:DNA replication and repair protein RecF